MKQIVPSGAKRKHRRILYTHVFLFIGALIVTVGSLTFFFSFLFYQSHSLAAEATDRKQQRQVIQSPTLPVGTLSSARSPANVPSSSSGQTSASETTTATASSDLSDAALVGNSYIQDLEMYNLLPKSDFYDHVGLTVQTIFTKSTNMGHAPIINALAQKQYKKVLLLFGENELGWYDKPFSDDYSKVIDAVRQRQPNATIYIQSIFPISAAESAKNIEQTNNQRIVHVNGLLQQLAQVKGVKYLDVASAVIDPDGNLPDGAAQDGIHFNKTYCQKWVDYLKIHV